MPDRDPRQHLTETVYRNLADRSFRELLTATVPDGSRPVIVALPTDSVQMLLGKLEAAGGAGNVVVPKANGFVVVAMGKDHDPHAGDGDVAALTHECTVGVFIARVLSDGGEGTYRFVVQGPGTQKGSGRAELVAVGR